MPHSKRHVNKAAQPARQNPQAHTEHDLLPWADPYIASLIAAHEQALQATGHSHTESHRPSQAR